MFDYDKMFSSKTDESFPASPKYDRYQSGEGYHVVSPPYIGTFMPPNPDLVFHDAPNVNETAHTAFNVELSPTKPEKNLSHRPSAPIIKDWVSDSEDDSEAELPQNAPTANHKTAIPKPKTHSDSRNRKACFVCKSLTYLIEDCDYYEKQMATPARNHAHKGNHQQYARMTHPNPYSHVVPTLVLTRYKLVPLTAARPVTTVVLPPHVTRPRPAKTVVTKPHSPPRRNINRRPSPKPSNFLPKVTTVKAPKVNAVKGVQGNWGNPQHALKDKGVIDSRCSRHMIGNMSYLSDFEEINGGYVVFGRNPKGGKISGKGKIRTGKLDFDDVYFVKELKFNLFSVSQMYDKKNSVLFTDTECIVLSSEFKLPDENQVLLGVPRENNMYNVDLKNVILSRDLTCLFAKATLDKSNLWHRSLGNINFKTMNKLVKGNLVRGLPSKVFENNHTCVACKKGKQHIASCKTKFVSSVSQPLQRLHMDLFGPTFVKSLNKKSYCLVVTDDYSRFTWVFFLATKDETSPIFKTFITGIENQLSLKVKIIKSDNGTEFKNQDLNQFCRMKGIKRDFSVPRTPQQNGIAERKNRTLIEAARTMLADLLLPIPFWAEAVNTACYVHNKVLVTKPHNKTPYELLLGRTSSIGFMRHFGCLVSIFNTLDPLGKFDGKADDGFLVGYSNTDRDATFEVKEPEFKVEKHESEVHVSKNLSGELEDFSDNSINEVNAAGTLVPTVGQISTNNTNTFSVVSPFNTVVSLTLEKYSYIDPSQYLDDPNMLALEDITYSDDEEDVGADANFTNLEKNIKVSHIPTTRVHKYHLVTQIIGDLSSATQTRSMTRVVKDQGGLTQINNEDFHTCMFACFLSQKESKRDERGIIVRNKARLFAQGHTQEEGIDYKEVFALVSRIEAIRTIEEDVYVCQPPGFEDPDYPDKVYKVVKALYGLHQAPRAWYETLANYLLENGFQRGKIDQTLFIKKQKGDILLVQVYVDDIIFGSTNKDLCKAFEKLMKDKFQMSSMDGKSASTPINTKKPLLKDPDGEDVDVHTYRSMIGSLIQENFYISQGQATLGLMYPKDSPFSLVAYLDSDYAGANLDRKSTTGGCQFLGCRLISWQCKKQTVVATSSTKEKVIITKATSREALRLDNAKSIDCLPNEEIFIELSRMGYEKPSTKLTFYKAFFSQQWKFLIHIILQCISAKRTSWNEFSSSMALAVIYLSTGRKFNFSMYIFDSLVMNVDSSSKFYMYPRFLQLMIRAQVGKGFSRVETPLFDGVIVAQQVDDVADEVVAGVDVDDVPTVDAKPTLPSPTPTTQPPPPSLELPSTSQVIPTPPSSPIAEPSSPLQQQQPSQPTHDAEIPLDLLHTLLETCTTLFRKVEALKQDKVAEGSQDCFF
nr:hypothetical protein [Tanacetum cinerariifolium]